MTIDSADITPPSWRAQLPTLTARQVTLREAAATDLRPLMDLLSIGDASRFGIDEPVSELAAQQLIDRSQRERAAGTGFLYVVTIGATRSIVGLTQVRQLDLGFETAEWECTLAPSWRGTGAFVEVARLVGSFAFGTVGALRKLGAVQEGILRESARRGDDYVDQVLWSLLKEDWGEHWISLAPRVH